jgi:zinc/manganese transport system substrate-binding protein
VTGSGTDVEVVIVNAQTGGAETAAVIAKAEERGIPVLSFSETLPDGQTYLSWMLDNAERLSEALES